MHEQNRLSGQCKSTLSWLLRCVSGFSTIFGGASWRILGSALRARQPRPEDATLSFWSLSWQLTPGVLCVRPNRTLLSRTGDRQQMNAKSILVMVSGEADMPRPRSPPSGSHNMPGRGGGRVHNMMDSRFAVTPFFFMLSSRFLSSACTVHQREYHIYHM